MEAFDRRAKIVALDGYLAQLEADLGPVPAENTVAAQAWADDLDLRLVHLARPRRRKG